MNTVMLLLAAVGIIVLPTVTCFPGGPPSSVCQSMIPVGHFSFGGQEKTDSFFSLNVDSPSFSPGGEVLVTVQGSNSFRGLFLQVRDGPNIDQSNAVGTWTLPDGLYGFTDCSGANFPQNSALSHNSRADKQPGAQQFRWAAPDSCTNGAQYTVRATVVQVFATIQAGITTTLTCQAIEPPPPRPRSTTTPVVTETPSPSPLLPVIQPSPLPPIFPPLVFPSVVIATTPARLPFVPPSPEVQCSFSDLDSIPSGYDNNFEDGNNILQGWEAIGANYRWVRRTGPTPSLVTGPTSAFEGEYYVYSEASSPAQQDDEAILQTDSNLRGCFCLRFDHSQLVLGTSHSLTLEIGNSVVSVINQRTTAQWVPRSFQVDSPEFVRIRVIARRGTNWLGDIGLDNIRITPGVC